MGIRNIINSIRWWGAAVLSTFGALRSFVRVLPLFFSACPGTALRVLCIMAFDFLHRCRHGRSLSRRKRRLLAALLDFGALLNALHDHKGSRAQGRGICVPAIKEADFPALPQYARELGALERARPSPLGNEGRFQSVRIYREGVVRLALGMLATAAGFYGSLEEGIGATASDADVNFLFRIVMHCQVIDDVLDYRADLAGALPSFLTASVSLSRALELTRSCAREYATVRHIRPMAHLFPLWLALVLTSFLTNALMTLARVRRSGSVAKGLGGAAGVLARR